MNALSRTPRRCSLACLCHTSTHSIEQRSGNWSCHLAEGWLRWQGPLRDPCSKTQSQKGFRSLRRIRHLANTPLEAHDRPLSLTPLRHSHSLCGVGVVTSARALPPLRPHPLPTCFALVRPIAQGGEPRAPLAAHCPLPLLCSPCACARSLL